MNILNRIGAIFAVFVSAILLLSIGSYMLNQQNEHEQNDEPIIISSSDPEPFYVGVTYCGDSVSEAKQLIDKVKTYTNLFVLQSGALQRQPDKINQIVNYAVDSDLHFIVYFGNQHPNYRGDWLRTFDNRWDNHFLGVYYGDEPGGKMLDSNSSFFGDSTLNMIRKWMNGSISCNLRDISSSVTYQPDGIIVVNKKEHDNFGLITNVTYTTYNPNGTITVEIQENNGPRIQIENNYSVSRTYEELWNVRPFQSYDETSDRFINTLQLNIMREIQDYWDVTAFTSDYTLYWFDYLSGYDVILAQFGWNHTLTQDIALVRGAANLQNKSWGTIITWNYNQPPYLDSGEAIYEQMRTAYEAGAKYAVIFNYATNMTGPYGTLQEEHFEALESFWNDVVQNPEVKQGSIRGEAVLGLPKNYGWGMRRIDDKIWGLWEADEKSEQIWNLRGDLIQKYGLNLDIVYDDPEFPVEGKYVQTIYWNQTN